MILNQEYDFQQIEEFERKENYNSDQLGNGVIGETFIVLRNNYKDITISFMLIVASSKKNFYKCIYNDLK
jgi:hypothetical protein